MTNKKKGATKKSPKQPHFLQQYGKQIGMVLVAIFALLMIIKFATGGGELNSPAKNMIPIKGGTFQMGDALGDNERSNEQVHTVALSDYSIGKYEVTFEEYDAYCDATGKKKPDDRRRGSRPVINVSWYDVVAYCNWLSKQQGYTPVYTIDDKNVTANWQANGYRLPTEAEWEYAARERGKNIRFGNGKNVIDPSEINFDADEEYKKSYSVVGTYRAGIIPVRSLNSPNSLGLYDMSGNVREWCWDRYDDYENLAQQNPKGDETASNRVYRGGSWNSNAEICRVASRNYGYPEYRNSFMGFRLARS